MIERFGLGPESLVVELASNDGYLLQHFVERGVPSLGIDPAANVAEAADAREASRRSSTFFDSALAETLVAEGGTADLVVANNVLAQVPELNDFVAGIETVLADDGVATIEVPHLVRLIEGLQFDTIYHEHYSYFSLTTLVRLFASATGSRSSTSRSCRRTAARSGSTSRTRATTTHDARASVARAARRASGARATPSSTTYRTSRAGCTR